MAFFQKTEKKILENIYSNSNWNTAKKTLDQLLSKQGILNRIGRGTFINVLNLDSRNELSDLKVEGYSKPTAWVLLIFGCCFSIAFGYLSFIEESDYLIVTIIFFLTIPFSIYLLTDKTTRLSVDASGIQINTTELKDSYKWSDLLAIYWNENRGTVDTYGLLIFTQATSEPIYWTTTYLGKSTSEIGEAIGAFLRKNEN